MAADQQTFIRIFDRVRLRTTRNVKYLSAPPGAKVDPKGVWSVAAAVQEDLLLTKDTVTIRIPAADVLKVIEHDMSRILNVLDSVRQALAAPQGHTDGQKD